MGLCPSLLVALKLAGEAIILLCTWFTGVKKNFDSVYLGAFIR